MIQKRTYAEIISNARYFALRILKVKDLKQGKVKAMRLLVLHWQIYELMEELKRLIPSRVIQMSAKEQKNYDQLKALVPDSHELQVLFIVIDDPDITKEDLSEFGTDVVRLVAELNTKEAVNDRVEFYSKNLQKFLELTKEYE